MDLSLYHEYGSFRILPISQTPSAQLAAAFPLSWSQFQFYLPSKEVLKTRLMEWAEAALQSESGGR
jgi:hypothetical protein